MLTKKHYEAIARIAKQWMDDAEQYDRESVDMVCWQACNLADYFAKDNPRFDRARFLKACGLEG